MSKVDGLRALREARYAANAATATSAARPPAAARRPAATVVKPAKAATSAAAVPADASAEDCGHRNMSGRGCTRPQGHSEKSHRYTPKA
ncbi:MAG: hypothetical protein ABIO67_01145 [Mycobacteriales bacterium]